MHNIIEFTIPRRIRAGAGLATRRAARRLLSIALPACAATLPLAASADDGYWVSAPVLSVDPVVVERTVERPIQHCTETSAAPAPAYDDRYERRRDNRFVPSLVGGLVGGLVGHQFGGGTSRKILTVVGALAGSSIANDIARERRREQAWATPVRRCYTTYERDTVEAVDGYHVVYEYGGQTFARRMEQHPGDEVRVHVQVSPAAEG